MGGYVRIWEEMGGYVGIGGEMWGNVKKAGICEEM